MNPMNSHLSHETRILRKQYSQMPLDKTPTRPGLIRCILGGIIVAALFMGFCFIVLPIFPAARKIIENSY